MQWVKTKQQESKKDWHIWFAWKPVTVQVYSDGNERKVWLEKVLRRFVLKEGRKDILIPPNWVPEYKELPKEKHIPVKINDEDRPSSQNTSIDPEVDENIEKLSSGNIPQSDYDHISPKEESVDCRYLLNRTEFDDDEANDVIPFKEERPRITKVILRDDNGDGFQEHLKKCKENVDNRPEWKKDSLETDKTDKKEKHPIDAAWEAKSAKRNKTIM